MTREEAYNRIDAIIAKNEIDDEYVTITNPKDYDALRIARKTLEQQPTTKENLVVEDCISRTKLKEYISKDESTDFLKGWNRAIDAIYITAPSIQPKSMQVDLEGDGYADGKLVYDYGKCPKCGWDFEYGDKDWLEPYCCHCGQRLHWFESEDKE